MSNSDLRRKIKRLAKNAADKIMAEAVKDDVPLTEADLPDGISAGVRAQLLDPNPMGMLARRAFRQSPKEIVGILQQAQDEYAGAGFNTEEDLSTLGTILRVKNSVVEHCGLDQPTSFVIVRITDDDVTGCYLRLPPIGLTKTEQLAYAREGDVIIPEADSPFSSCVFVSKYLTITLDRTVLWSQVLQPLARIPKIASFLPTLPEPDEIPDKFGPSLAPWQLLTFELTRLAPASG